MTQRYRFRPRYRALPFVVAALGAGLIGAGLFGGLEGASRTFAIAAGPVGVVLAALYLASPAWRIVVVVDDEALEVLSGADRRFRVAWGEVTRLVSSPRTTTLFLDGGAPERSLLVPGQGASAPYDIERKAELCRAILARVPPAVVEEVALLETALRNR